MTPRESIAAASTSPAELGQLDFFLALFRPLLSQDEAAFLLGEPSLQTITRRLEDGSLRGVDISLAGEDAGRRELRIYRYAVEHLLIAPPAQKKPVRVPVERIFPHARPVFRQDEVAAILRCTPKHVGRLKEASELRGPRLSTAAAPGASDRTPRVSRESLIEFLTRREIQP